MPRIGIEMRAPEKSHWQKKGSLFLIDLELVGEAEYCCLSASDSLASLLSVRSCRYFKNQSLSNISYCQKICNHIQFLSF
jgi:hypothetical protein